MIPFMQEFEAGHKLKLGDIEPQEYAIILAMHFPRALLVRVESREDKWVTGIIIAPVTYQAGVPEPFSRSTATTAVRVPVSELRSVLAANNDAPVHGPALLGVPIDELVKI
jgi:hypothetical protein